jgi:hypothetical protein
MIEEIWEGIEDDHGVDDGGRELPEQRSDETTNTTKNGSNHGG